MITVVKNPDGSFTIRLDADSQVIFDRVVLEHAGRLSEVGIIDAIYTSWLSQQRQRHESDDFANLTPRQRKTAIDAGKVAPR